jgi:steroid delta-isomerase-like uncharacterized protein
MKRAFALMIGLLTGLLSASPRLALRRVVGPGLLTALVSASPRLALRRVVGPGLLTALLSACASESVEAPPPVPVDWRSINAPAPLVVKGPTAKERAIAEAYVAALASPKLTGVGLVWDDIGHVAFGSRDTRGREKVVLLHEMLFGAFEDRKSAVERIWRTDDKQVVEWVVTGVQAREWMGIPATQRPVVIRGVAFLWTEDQGTIADGHIYFSIPVVKAQLGVGPKELQEFVASVQPIPPPAPPFDQEGSQGEKDNEKVVRDMLDAFEQGKETEFLAAFADNVEVDTLHHPRTTKKEDIRTYFHTMRKAIGQLDTTIQSISAVKQYVLLEDLISGEQYAGVGYTPAPNDHAAWIQVAEVLEMTTDHKIAHIWRYENPDLPPLDTGH